VRRITGTRGALQEAVANGMHFHSFRLTTIRTERASRDNGSPVRMLAQPRVGRPMVMYGSEGNRRIVTSRVVRMFEDFTVEGTYVETENTLYLLQPGATQ
jgi:hypothetical protein